MKVSKTVVFTMWDTIVLGQVPGTSKYISFSVVLLASLVLLLAVLSRSIARRRSSLYWRIYAEMQLNRVEDQLFSNETALGEHYENPFVRAEMRHLLHESKRTTAQALAGYFHRTAAALRAGSVFQVPGQAEQPDHSTL